MGLMYINSYKKYYYLILAGFMVDYKEQVFITDIKTTEQIYIPLFFIAISPFFILILFFLLAVSSS